MPSCSSKRKEGSIEDSDELLDALITPSKQECLSSAEPLTSTSARIVFKPPPKPEPTAPPVPRVVARAPAAKPKQHKSPSGEISRQSSSTSAYPHHVPVAHIVGFEGWGRAEREGVHCSGTSCEREEGQGAPQGSDQSFLHRADPMLDGCPKRVASCVCM